MYLLALCGFACIRIESIAPSHTRRPIRLNHSEALDGITDEYESFFLISY